MSEKEFETFENELDSPLVVHKESDASYNGCPNFDLMNKTAIDENDTAPSIERHRFKKKKKNPNKNKIITIVLLVVLVAVCVGVTVHFVNDSKSNENKNSVTAEETTKSLSEVFKNTITVQGTTIYYEAEVIDNVVELESNIKFLPKDTQIIIQNEHADSDFFESVKEVVLQCEFEKEPKVEFIQSSGLNETSPEAQQNQQQEDVSNAE